MTASSAENERATGIPAGPCMRWRWRLWHVWLLLAGLLLRLGYGLSLSKTNTFGGWDGQEFHAFAHSLLHFQGDDYLRYFDCVRAPFYPIFLIPFVAISPEIVWPIQLAQAFLGLLQAWLLGLIATRWAGERAGQWAFGLAALHPILIYQSAFILTECLFTTLLWGGMACLLRLTDPPPADRRRWLTWAGVLLGLGCLTRPALQPFLVVAVLWLGLVSWRRRGAWPALREMSAFTAVVSALLLPWLLGNLWVHHEFTLAPRNAPMAYALGRSREYLATYEARTKDEYYRALNQIMEKISVHSSSAPEDWVAESRQFQREHPAEWRRLQRHKLVHFWTPWLNPLIFSRLQFWISFLWLTPMFVLAALELWRRRRQPDAFLWLLIGVVAVGYLVGGYLFQVQIRYRLPFVDVAFVVLTAAWLGQVGRNAGPGDRLAMKFRPIQVLWISCVGEKGGAEVYMLNLLRHLDRTQFTPAVAMLRPGPLGDELRRLNVVVHEFPAHRMRNLWEVLRTVRALGALIRQQGVFLVHSNGFRAHVYGGVAAWLAGVPEVWTVHTVEKPGLFTRAVLTIPTAHVIANCPRTADYFIRQSCPVSLIWPSVDLEQLAQRTARAELVAIYGVPAASRWICLGARMQRYKGHEFFLRAIASLPGNYQDVHGIIIGGTLFGQEPAYFMEMKALAARLGIASRVHFTGFVSDADLRGLVAASELLVHPALDEDFGLIVAEAQALERPVLAFDAVGPAAILAPEETGRLVPVGNQEKLNAALEDLLSRPATLRQWGTAGGKRAGGLFASGPATRQLERVYATCLPAGSGCMVVRQQEPTTTAHRRP